MKVPTAAPEIFFVAEGKFRYTEWKHHSAAGNLPSGETVSLCGEKLPFPAVSPPPCDRHVTYKSHRASIPPFRRLNIRRHGNARLGHGLFRDDYMKTVTVTKPSLPPLEEYVELLRDIWDRQWLTNKGHYHDELEKGLAEYLGVPYVSLFATA